MGSQRNFEPRKIRSPFVNASALNGLSRCVHCGLCVPHCPTFQVLRTETDAPRGRIHLMGALVEGRVGPSPVLREHLDLCLLCRHCEEVCPSGVPFSPAMEEVRRFLIRRGGVWAKLRVEAMRALLHPLAGISLWALGNIGALGYPLLPLMGRLLPSLAFLAAYLPHPQGAPSRKGSLLARPTGRPKGRAAILVGCVMPYLFPQTHRATVSLLALAGYEVVAPLGQTCCGALFAHMGRTDTAKHLARRNIDAFLKEKPDVIVVNAAGCGAMLKEYPRLLQEDEEYLGKARQVAALTRDVTELLAQSLPPPQGTLRAIATYQDPCHLAHVQKVRQPPRQLLRMIPQLQLIEMESPDTCCGGAGLYPIFHPAVARAIARHRLEAVLATGAQMVVTANPGCTLALSAATKLWAPNLKVMHVVDVVWQAWRKGAKHRHV